MDNRNIHFVIAVCLVVNGCIDSAIDLPEYREGEQKWVKQRMHSGCSVHFRSSILIIAYRITFDSTSFPPSNHSLSKYFIDKCSIEAFPFCFGSEVYYEDENSSYLFCSVMVQV